MKQALPSVCCHIPCDAPAAWRIRHGDELDEYTESCTDHVGALLTDAVEHRIFPITAPLLKGTRRKERAAAAKILGPHFGGLN